MALDRTVAVELIRRYLPSTGYLQEGQVGFDHIAKDYGGHKYGTTCGFLPQWMLWRLGCDDASLVNRYEPDSKFRSDIGQNLIKIDGYRAFYRLMSRRSGAETAQRIKDLFGGQKTPEPGDPVIITGKPLVTKDGKSTDSSHVFVVLQETGRSSTEISWEIAQAGQRPALKEAAHITHTKARLQGGKAMVGDRWIIGWLPLSDVPFGGTPLGDLADALAAYSEDSSQGPPTARQAIGVWEVSGGSATGYYMFYKGHRVFYIHPASPAVILGSGFWLPQGGELRVLWPQTTQRWTLSPDGRSASGSVDGGPSITARKLTTGTDTVLQSFKQARGLPVAKAQP